LSLETIADDILEDLNTISDLLRKDQDSSRCKLEFLLGSMHDPSQRPGLVKFLRNAILLFLGVFPRNYILEEALLITTTYSAKENSLPTPSNASRALAKNLLKRDRQVLFLTFYFLVSHYFGVQHVKRQKTIKCCCVFFEQQTRAFVMWCYTV
jgi:hypothetical protein